MYHGARVPLANLLGPEGGGFVLAQDRLGPGAHPPLHALDRHLRAGLRHPLRARRHPRSSRPATCWAARQMVQQWIAESRAEIDAARLLVLHAAWKIEREGAPAARQEISIIKFTVARTLQRVLDRAIQALGALGMTDDTPLAFWYAHERAGRIYDGADEVHISSVAKRILPRYAKGKARGDA